MATKIERTITVPESMYNKILKLAEEERSNVPFVTRQLLVKALADEGKNRPDWFYEIQSQIVALRNEVLVDQRPKKEEVVAGELLGQLQKQIATLTKAVSAVEKDPQVDRVIAGKNAFAKSVVTRHASASKGSSGDEQDLQRESAVALCERINRNITITALAALNESDDFSKPGSIELGDHWDLLWDDDVESHLSVSQDEMKSEAKQQGEEPNEPVVLSAVVQEQAEAAKDVVIIKSKEKGNVLRPFFGRLTKIFGVVLN